MKFLALGKPKRLLLIRIEAAYIQLLLLNKEGKLYGVEECCSLELMEAGKTLDNTMVLLKEELIRIKEQWQLEKEEILTAIAYSEIYQEEFSLPLLPMKQLKRVLQEEIALRVPMEEKSYCSAYNFSREEEEYNIQLVALENYKLERLEELLAAMEWKLYCVSSLICVRERELGEIELWNCFHQPEQKETMLEEYRDLLCFGKECLEKSQLPNLVKREPFWHKGPCKQQTAVFLGGLILTSCLIAYPWLYYTVEKQKEETASLRQELLELQPWLVKRNNLIKLQQELKKRETLYKQLKLRENSTSIWLELLGRVLPGDCWLTMLEHKKEALYIKGCFQQKGSVELLRKLLLATGKCRSCELVESNMEMDGRKGNFTLKVIL